MRKMGSPTVLQIQTDTGLSGGIAGYVSTLVRSHEFRGFRSIAVVPEAQTNPVRTQSMYGDAVTVVMPPTYSLATFTAYGRALERLVRQHHVALMHAHALRSALACAWVSRRTGVPFVYTNHGLRYTQKPAGLARRVFRVLEAWVCRHAQAVVCIRPFDAARLIEAGLVQPGRLHTIATRIDAPGLVHSPTPPRACPPRIVGIGSLIDVKRPDRFIDWVAALRDLGIPLQASWIGDGPLRQAMQERSARLGADIVWRGHLSAQEVALELAQASVLALSSQFEVFPLAVLEAYAQGVPVVAGRFDGVQDFLDEDRSGLIVRADEPAQVAAAVSGLLQDRDRWQSFSDHARQLFAQRFEGRGRMAAEYAGLYRSCLA